LKKLAVLITGLLLAFTAATASWADDTEVVHVVKKGDTLWDITHHYLSNPWKWPVVWSNNEDITNPHLIFPGDQVVISSKSGKTVIKIIPAKGGGEPVEYTPAGVAGVKDKTFMISPQFGTYMYSPSAMTGAGTVVKKVDVGELMARDEDIIIKSKSGLAKGKGVTIVTLVSEIKDKGVTKGYLYKAIGIAKIVDAQEALYKAVVADSSQEIRAGDIVLDDLRTIAPLKVKLYEPALKQAGRVIDLYGGSVHGSSYLDLIFLSLGKKDGVDRGAVVSLHQEATVDGETGTIRNYRGNALVIQALDDSSLALVTESVDAIQRDLVVLGK
jgi:hypothetical protein